tara:strand:- start:27308 stop:28201 length:894 start_codon:yes stop_codon:yes gene_type:complete
MARYVFFGDSHTCGLEIEDHLVLDNDFDMVNIMKEGLIDQYDFKTATVMWHMHMAQQANMTPWEFINRDIESSYPHILGKLHDVEIKKYCQTASSMDYVLLQLENLHSIGEISPDKDVLFIGMCRPTRTYTLDESEGRYNFAFENVDGKSADDPEMAQLLKRFGEKKEILLSEFLTDNKLVASFYSALSGIMNFAELNNYKLHLLPHFNQDYIKVDGVHRPETIAYKTHCETKQEWMYYDFCIDTYNRAIEYMVNELHHLTYFQHDRDRCGFFHPDSQAHKFFAESLAENIDKTGFN